MESLMSFVTGDHEKCIQCKACEIACHLAHHDHERTAGNLEVPIVPKLFTKTAKGAPVQCHQCEDAPCVQACLEKAISIKDGKVVIDVVQCEGCKNYTDCVNACPFEAIAPTAFFIEGSELIRGKMQKHLLYANKCDLCEGQKNGPACIAVCPEQALRLVDLQQDKKEKNQRAVKNMAGMIRN